MASVGEVDEEYESDPEQAKLSLKMRRREASDDEEDADEREVLPHIRRVDSRVSDCESDGQGAAADYDEEKSDLDEEEYEEEVEEEYYEERESGGGHGGVVEAPLVTEAVNNRAHEEETIVDEKLDRLIYGEYNGQDDHVEDNAQGQEEKEEKKENEPFAVPTAGAFYMHDDRLRGAGGRHGVGEVDEEYESDPEQAKLSLTMRRREASDDEEDADEREVLPHIRRVDSRVSDCESDGQGAAADYDEEKSDFDDEYEEEVEEEYYEERESGGGHGVVVEAPPVSEAVNNRAQEDETIVDEKLDGLIDGEYSVQGQEEKKENEPFAVPTAGAFYMHDDRLRGAGGRHGRTFGGNKLWVSKDDQKWGHDKFEEMTMQERHYEEGRRVSRGRSRGRGRNRGEDRGYPQGHQSRPFSNNNQNNMPKTIRGRGPRRYVPTFKKNNDAPIQSKQSGKLAEKSSHAGSGRTSAITSSLESAPVPATRSNVLASSLNSASPPFYPSGSSTKEINLTQKRDQAGPINQNLRPPVMGDSFSVPQSNSMRGKSSAGSVGMDNLHIDDSTQSLAGKPQTNLHVPVSGPPFINSTQPPPSRVQGRGSTSLGQMAYQTTVPPHHNVNILSSPNQHHGFQRAPVLNRLQPPLQATAQQVGQRSSGGSQASSPPKAALSTPSLDSVETESATALVGKGKGNAQGSGRGSFPYAGTQVLGPAGSLVGGHGDQNFPFLPVMQFGGQHPGGIPAVGMAFPGYVSQPNGGNSEMTWLPVLAGAAGALGASYPYLTVDGAYHARPSGQTSALAIGSSKENITNKSGNELKPAQRTELVNDEHGQRQNKPRRYTEMKFGQ